MAFCPCCHQPISESSLQRLMRGIRQRDHERAQIALARREGLLGGSTESISLGDVAPRRWSGEGYDG